jgi:hypothetical protein
MKNKSVTINYPDGSIETYATPSDNVAQIEVMTERGMYLWIMFKDGTDLKIYNTSFTILTN